MSNFYEDVIKKDSRFNTTKKISDLALLEPGTRAAVLALVSDAKKEGHNVFIMETYRSCARQSYLFMKKYTQLKKVGVHHYGLAADIGLELKGLYDPNGADYMFLVELCQKHGLVSGIDWGTPQLHHSFRDYDHVQRVPVHMQDELFAGEWYPAPIYDPLGPPHAVG